MTQQFSSLARINKNTYAQRYLSKMFTAALFVRAQNWRQPPRGKKVSILSGAHAMDTAVRRPNCAATRQCAGIFRTRAKRKKHSSRAYTLRSHLCEALPWPKYSIVGGNGPVVASRNWGLTAMGNGAFSGKMEIFHILLGSWAAQV